MQLPLPRNREQKQGTVHAPYNTTDGLGGVGQPPQPTLRPNPWTCPSPLPMEGTSSPRLSEQVNNGPCWTGLHLPAEAGVLRKAFPEFPLWRLINCS